MISKLSLIAEATLSAFTLRKLFNGQFSFEKVTYVFAFICVCLFFIPFTALPAVWTNTVFYNVSFVAGVRDWFIGSIIGVIVFCSFLVTIEKLFPHITQIPKPHIFKFILSSLLVVFVTYYIFQSGSSGSTLLSSYAYMIMPILVFGAYRYDVTGASAIALLLSVSALYGAFDATVKNSIISIAYRATPSISLFLFISVTISLILSEANTERKQAKKSWKVLLITMH